MIEHSLLKDTNVSVTQSAVMFRFFPEWLGHSFVGRAYEYHEVSLDSTNGWSAAMFDSLSGFFMLDKLVGGWAVPL